MKTLSQQIDSLNQQLIKDNKRIISILTSLQNNRAFNTNIFDNDLKEECNRNSKIRSRVVSRGKKEKSKGEARQISTSFRTVKRLNSSGSTAAFQRCDSCKLMKKQLSNPNLGKTPKKDRKYESYGLKKESGMMKLKKMSQKVIPKVSSKYIYAKKAFITHFQKTTK